MSKGYKYQWWKRLDLLFVRNWPFIDLHWIFAQESLRRMSGDYSTMIRAKNKWGYMVYVQQTPNAIGRRFIGPRGTPLVSVSWADDEIKMRGLFRY